MKTHNLDTIQCYYSISLIVNEIESIYDPSPYTTCTDTLFKNRHIQLHYNPL
jgi:hypothetical protein